MKYEQWNPAPGMGRRNRPCCSSCIPLAALTPGGPGDPPREEASSFGCRAGTAPRPHAARDMDAAVERINRALEQGETIAIYGDYDVDGITATCLLSSYS